MRKVFIMTVVSVLIAAMITIGVAQNRKPARPAQDPCFDNRGRWYTRVN